MPKAATCPMNGTRKGSPLHHIGKCWLMRRPPHAMTPTLTTISKLNPKVLKGMLIELTKHNKVRNSNAYKKPSRCSDFHQRLSCIHDTLKEAPKCHRVCTEDPAQETLNKH